jgi:Gluconate 2-dehydrogenase subunit 3
MGHHRDDPDQPEHDRDDLGVAGAWPDSGLGRRDLLRTATAASVLLATAGQAAAQPAAAPPPGTLPPDGKFLLGRELALVDELSEIIIPTDDHSPGARGAKVATEIDRRLADGPAYDQDAVAARRRWREGLALVDELSRRRFGVVFLSATPGQRLELVSTMAAGEKKPGKPEERFFIDLKREAARAYYTSEIGVKQELEYKGNSYLQEFAGHDASTVPLRRKPKG